MAEGSEHQIMMRMVDALRQASGCAGQLAHAQRNPQFLAIRDTLEAMAVSARKLAMARAMPEASVLDLLARRQAAH